VIFVCCTHEAARTAIGNDASKAKGIGLSRILLLVLEQIDEKAAGPKAPFIQRR